MAITASQLRRLNRKFGERFGFNPHGQPNFRWARTELMSRFILDKNGLAQRQSGVFVWEPRVERRSWAERYGRCWILCKWKHYTEEQWYAMIGSALPYPKMGDWEPVENVRLGPEYPERPPDPNEESTLEACAAIAADRARVAERYITCPENDLILRRALEDESDAAHRKVVNDRRKEIAMELDDLTPAFGKLPGSHAGSTEFFSGIKGA